jgi:hypothetical protein
VERVDGAVMEERVVENILRVMAEENGAALVGGWRTDLESSAGCGGPGVYVDIVWGSEGGGRSGVFEGRSGVYLLPGHYDPSLVEGKGKKKAGWTAVVEAGKMVGEVVTKALL